MLITAYSGVGRDLPVPHKNPAPKRLIPPPPGIDRLYDKDLDYLMDKLLKSLTEGVGSSHGIITGALG